MIRYKNGCLIEAFKAEDIGVIAHQCNCFNTMNSGVAKAIRLAFPEAYSADCETERGDVNKLGNYSFAKNNYGLIFNLYGQYNYGRDGSHYTQLASLEEALENMAIHLTDIGYKGKVGIPKLGCGLGGASWDQVSKIVARALDNFEVIVYSI
jgi:O-acetyl-ADP-ribose deacetylase (regulator of RNase III)